ncbi:MAG: molybdenum cofactor guanylyltransferase [Bacillota bacterium]
MSESRRWPKIAAIILAGGRGLRLGHRDKALVPLAGSPLIEHVLAAITPIAEETLIVSNRPQALRRYGLRVVSDEVLGAGPLGGIYTGLRHARYRVNLVVGCDMPFVSGDLVRHMISVSPGTDAVVPRIGRFIEPLCALYDRNLIDTMEDALGSARFKIGDLLLRVHTHYVTEEIVRGFDPKLLSFMNVNTPEDLGRAEEVIAGEWEDRIG